MQGCIGIYHANYGSVVSGYNTDLRAVHLDLRVCLQLNLYYGLRGSVSAEIQEDNAISKHTQTNNNYE